MEIKAVKRQIKDRALSKFYIFTGEEIEAQRLYVEKMAEVTARTVTRVETVADVFKFKSGIIKTARLFVVWDDKEFMDANKGGKAWENLDELLGDKILILQLSSLDKRTKFYKQFEDRVVTFNYMEPDVLYKYVKRQVDLTDTHIIDLINICGCDYARLLLETDKIKQYSEVSGAQVDTAYAVLVRDGTIYRSPEDAIFDFVDAVLQAKPNVAYRLLEDCKALGEPSLRLITVLYSNMKRVLQVQTCEDKDISGATGLTAWDIKCTQKNLNHWDSRDLVYFLKMLHSVEKAIKTGEIDEAVALDYALTQMF